MNNILEVSQLEVIYNRVATAIQGVSIVVPEGSIIAIVGTNGAGKTTTLRAITGFLPAENVAISNGGILFDGTPLHNLRPHQTAALGIAIVPERAKIFDTLTVADNLAMVAPARRRGVSVEEIHRYFPRLRERHSQVAGYMSGGEKQMLAIGMALLNRPRLLLIDELSLGLAPVVVQDLMKIIKQLNEELGISVLLVEQNVVAALDVARFTYIMENGRIVHSGESSDLRNHADVREFYLGGQDGEGAAKNYRDVKQYSRKRRWWG
jgi:branched-chain amino acid transport system ATP-binding protein